MSNCKACDIEVTNPIDSTGNCVDHSTTPGTTPGAGPCVEGPGGILCPPSQNCSPWDLTEDPYDCLITDLIEEQLNISGAPLKVHKLLGIHEQGLLQDVTGNGTAISSGSLANNPATNAFDKYITEWRSLQTGTAVVRDAYIGYDFGPLRLANGRLRYGLDTSVQADISTVKIMQGCDAQNRATKIRIERSEDGKKWYGVSILSVQDCDGALTLNFKRTVPSRYWRIRPLEFNGGANDYWAVRVIQFIEYEATHISNIQDKILLENRDRDYQEFAVDIKAAYTPQENATGFDRFGFNPLGDQFVFEVSFQQCVQRLGRPFVIGDILMVPSERQYSASLRPIDKYLEVTDVFWSSNGFSATWTPALQKIVAKPLIASQETQDITGKLAVDVDGSNVFDINDGVDGKKYQDVMHINDTIRADARDNVPVKGVDFANSPVITAELKEYADKNPNMNVTKLQRSGTIRGQDAMPPNGQPYTEGDELPSTATAQDGAWHRLTYKSLGDNIPVRLHKFSKAKGRWMFMQADHKSTINAHRPFLDPFVRDIKDQLRLEDIDDKLK